MTRRSRNPRAIFGLSLLVCVSMASVSACATDEDPSGNASGDLGEDDDDGTGSDDDGMTTSPPITGDDGDADGDEDGDECGFLGCGDGGDDGGPPSSCDFWGQDCPQGEKCAPVASTPGNASWDAHFCVPAGTQPPGSSCTLAEGPNGTDTCDASGMCYDIDADTQQGTCVELCQAPEASPSCPQSGASVTCKKLNQGILNVCLTDCNPLLGGECSDGQTCVAAFEGQELGGFICFPPAAEGVSGEECACANCCAQGHMCVSAAEYGPGCQFDLCCTEYCDTTDGDASCSGSGQSCVALFDPNTPEIGNVGQCVVMQ